MLNTPKDIPVTSNEFQGKPPQRNWRGNCSGTRVVHFLGQPEAAATGSLSTLTIADELFFRLDGSLLDAGGRTWRIEICGIHGSGPCRWIQLELHGEHDESCRLTLRADHLGASRIRALLTEWLAQTREPEPMRVAGARRS